MCTCPTQLTAGSTISPPYNNADVIPIRATVIGRLSDQLKHARLTIDMCRHDLDTATNSEASADHSNMREAHRLNATIEDLTAIICNGLGLTADDGKLPEVYVDRDWMAYTA